MKKNVVLSAMVGISIILAILLVGCNDDKKTYGYKFSFDGGKAIYKSSNVYELLKDNNVIGYIRVQGENKDDGVYVEEKIDGQTISVYILTIYDKEKFTLTSSNATLTKQAITDGDDNYEITQYTPFVAVPASNDPYYFVQHYGLSKNSKEDINITISGLELFSAIDYNWELCAIGKVIEGLEDITLKGSAVYIDSDPYNVGIDLQINLYMKDESKTLFQKFGDETNTVAIECKFENDNYFIAYSDQILTANLVVSNNVGLSNKLLLKLDLGNDLFAYLIIKS